MKIIIGVVMGLFLLAGSVHAGNLRFEFLAQKKKIDASKVDSSSTETREEQWGYEVTIANRSFQDVEALKVEYILFMKDVQPGSKASARLVREKGSHEIERIENNRKATFMTEPMTLRKVQLKGGWVWASGANPRATDRLSGIWLRIYKDGEVVGEESFPKSLMSSEKWGD